VIHEIGGSPKITSTVKIKSPMDVDHNWKLLRLIAASQLNFTLKHSHYSICQASQIYTSVLKISDKVNIILPSE
jgi:hypothetical protein